MAPKQQLVRRCKYCGRDVTDELSAMAYAANPFCTRCLPDRIKKASVALGPVRREKIGGYMHIIPIRETRA